MALLEPGRSYTFSEYFKLGFEASELAGEFGYQWVRKRINLERYEGTLERIGELKERIEEVLPFVPLTNEPERREMIISRVGAELIHYTQAQLRIEYPIKVTPQLQGNLDYLFFAGNPVVRLLVIEAKYEDITRGFTQLAAEMIALDQWENTPGVNIQPVLVGAVTTGRTWELARLFRQERRFEQGLNTYRVPEDVEDVMRFLVAALRSTR